MSIPGCFVIARYNTIDLDNDLTDYLGVYVGAADQLGEGIAAACSRKGNPDVFADIKYKQHVRIFLFTCRESILQAKHDVLLGTLTDERLYNTME